jgi:hypothetical protein
VVLNHLAQHGGLRIQNFVGVMFNPTRTGKNLTKFLLGNRLYPTFFIKENSP